MKKRLTPQTRIAFPLAASVAFGLTATSQAQDASAPAEPEKMEKVVVTGSNIPTAETVAIAPVDVLSAEAIERSGAGGNLEILAKKLPSTVGSGNFGMSRGNGGDGTVGISLRGVPGGTLLLINGRRTANQDLNAIPLGSIERIEILKDGGSSIYGADAVAGVVNVIMKKNFTGTEVYGRYGNTTESDTGEQTYSFVTGSSTENTSVTIGGSYFRVNSLYSADRSRSRPDPTDPNQTSGTSNPGRIRSSDSAAAGVIPGGGLVYRGAPGTTGTSISQYTAYDASTDRFNYGLYTPAIRDAERYSIFGNGEQRLSGEWLKFFTEAYYTKSWSYNQLAASPIVFVNNTTPTSPDGIVIPADHPNNVFGVPINNMAYRPVELGPRIDEQDYDIFRFVSGLRGQIGDSSWNYETALLYTKQSGVNLQGNDISRTGLEQAINSKVDGQAFNPFGNGANSKAVLDGIRLNHYTFTEDELFLWDAKVNGEVVQLPAGPLGLALGTEFRQETGRYTPDSSLIYGNVVAFNSSLPYEGQRDVWAGFYEVNVPILGGEDFDLPLFHQFSVNTSGRFEDYSDFGNQFVPKIGLIWKPIDESFAIRASYSESFTAPGFGDLYSPIQESYPELRNPVKAAANDPEAFEQIRTFYMGNPQLAPTESENITVGGVYTPPFIKTLTLGVDYFKIEQEGVPGSVDQYILDQNYADGGPYNPNASFATNVVFDPASSNYNALYAPTLNLSKREISGLDFSAVYQWDTDKVGMFTLSGYATYYLTFEQENIPGDGMTDRLGNFIDPSQGFGLGSLPRFKGVFSLFWDYQKFQVGVTANYILSYLDDTAAIGYERTIDDYLTFDLQASYTLPYDVRLTAGCLNIADEEPPLVVGAFADNYDRDTHDLRGRFWYVEASKKF